MVVIMLFELLGLSLAPPSLDDPAEVVARDGGHQVGVVSEKFHQHFLDDAGLVSAGI